MYLLGDLYDTGKLHGTYFQQGEKGKEIDLSMVSEKQNNSEKGISISMKEIFFLLVFFWYTLGTLVCKMFFQKRKSFMRNNIFDMYQHKFYFKFTTFKVVTWLSRSTVYEFVSLN